MLNLMPTTFKQVKPLTVLGLIWLSYEHRKEIRQHSEYGHCVDDDSLKCLRNILFVYDQA